MPHSVPRTIQEECIMQRTEKYYENDPFLTRAEGRVLGSSNYRVGPVRQSVCGSLL